MPDPNIPMAVRSVRSAAQLMKHPLRDSLEEIIEAGVGINATRKPDATTQVKIVNVIV
jgi:hypothetical protein